MFIYRFREILGELKNWSGNSVIYKTYSLTLINHFTSLYCYSVSTFRNFALLGRIYVRFKAIYFQQVFMFKGKNNFMYFYKVYVLWLYLLGDTFNYHVTVSVYLLCGVVIKYVLIGRLLCRFVCMFLSKICKKVCTSLK